MTKIAGAMLVAAVAALAISGCAAMSGVGNGISAFGDSISDASHAAQDGRDHSLAYDPATCLPDSGKQPTALCKTQKAKTVRVSAARKAPKAAPASAAPASATDARPAATPVKATTTPAPKKAVVKTTAKRKTVKAASKTTVVNTAEGTKIRFKKNSLAYDPASCLPGANGKQPTTFCKDQKIPK